MEISYTIDYIILKEEIIYWDNKSKGNKNSILYNYNNPEYSYFIKMFHKKINEFIKLKFGNYKDIYNLLNNGELKK